MRGSKALNPVAELGDAGVGRTEEDRERSGTRWGITRGSAPRTPLGPKKGCGVGGVR